MEAIASTPAFAYLKMGEGRETDGAADTLATEELGSTGEHKFGLLRKTKQKVFAVFMKFRISCVKFNLYFQ